MKLWARVFLGYFLIVGLAGWFVLRVFVEQVKPGVREAVEDVMVDSAHLIAELAAEDLIAGRYTESRFGKALDAYSRRTVRAPIWGLEKLSLDFRVYVTDAKGIVRFDSEGEAVGQDYSVWRDVALTLRGQYGARSTRDDPEDSTSSSLYVAAPVMQGDRIVGVATVVKPVAALQPIIERSQHTVFRQGVLLLAATLLIGGAFTAWLTVSMGRLVRYAQALAAGERAEPPGRGRDEIGELSRALAALRQEVDGRAYVEHYVQHLTHEMKSPLTAIRGAAELLAEPMDEADRRRFAASAVGQAERLRILVDRLLRLAQLEHLATIDAPEVVDLAALLEELRQGFAPQAARKNLSLDVQADDGVSVRGDRHLLAQALSALIENAIEFSPTGGRVQCHGWRGSEGLVVTVRDQGPGIPDYARERIFERFYSLPRPDGGAKSTGLGLALALEVAKLHGGTVTVDNNAAGGVEARLTLP